MEQGTGGRVAVLSATVPGDKRVKSGKQGSTAVRGWQRQRLQAITDVLEDFLLAGTLLQLHVQRCHEHRTRLPPAVGHAHTDNAIKTPHL